MKKNAILGFLLLGVAFICQTSFAQVLDNTPPLDNFYKKSNTSGRDARAYVSVREADVYKKDRVWRIIDFRQTMNQYLYYPIYPVQDRVSLMSMIMTGFENGAFPAYDPITDDFTKVLTYEEFIKQNTTIKQIEQEDLDNPGEVVIKSDTSSFKNENVKMLRIKEDWFIDKQRSVRDIRILGICPIVQQFDEVSGELKGTRSLFWLYYDYVRPTFAKQEAFNRHNSAMRMSYDDVFAWQRFFESYITKADNQQDRAIDAYLSGINVMLQAEKIKYYLFDMEEDMWTY